MSNYHHALGHGACPRVALRAVTIISHSNIAYCIYLILCILIVFVLVNDNTACVQNIYIVISNQGEI